MHDDFLRLAEVLIFFPDFLYFSSVNSIQRTKKNAHQFSFSFIYFHRSFTWQNLFYVLFCCICGFIHREDVVSIFLAFKILFSGIIQFCIVSSFDIGKFREMLWFSFLYYIFVIKFA